jgi:copper chaperone CopZ
MGQVHHQPQKEKGQMAQAKLSVPDISCEHCERTITEKLGAQPGVERVQVDILAKQVILSFNETQIDLQKVQELLTEEGYPVAATEPA